MAISKIDEPKLFTGTFDLLVFKVILVSFGALFSKWPVTRKQVGVHREKRSEIWKSGVAVFSPPPPPSATEYGILGGLTQ